MKLNIPQYLGLLGVPFVIACGQILFKTTAVSNAGQGILGLASNLTFWIAIIIYGLATIAWIPTIESVPLNKAYVFMGLAYLYVPILSALFLNERITPMYILGIAVIIVGIAISTWR